MPIILDQTVDILPGQKKLSFRFKSANCSVMIWVCFCWSTEFLNVLNDQVIPSMDLFFPNGSGIFQDDKAKIHRALVVKEWRMRTHECQGALMNDLTLLSLISKFCLKINATLDGNKSCDIA